jgi:hypothetical protein
MCPRGRFLRLIEVALVESAFHDPALRVDTLPGLLTMVKHKVKSRSQVFFLLVDQMVNNLRN